MRNLAGCDRSRSWVPLVGVRTRLVVAVSEPIRGVASLSAAGGGPRLPLEVVVSKLACFLAGLASIGSIELGVDALEVISDPMSANTQVSRDPLV